MREGVGGDAVAADHRLRGDQGVAYGSVMELLGKVGEAGFARISLIAERPGGK
ncbi:MAG: hypothetical protein WCO86_12590 [Planctomycetota bacterium]